MDDLTLELLSFVRSISDNDAITAQTPLLEQGLIDSFTVLEILSFIEQRFAVELDLNKLQNEDLASVAALTRLVRAARAS